MCLAEVEDVLKKLEVEVLDEVIDRPHRIGKPRVVTGKKMYQMIVHFSTW